MLRNVLSSLLVLASTLFVAIGARISGRTHVDATSEGEPLKAGVKYACMQKWQTGAFSWQSKYVDEYCLVDMTKALDTAAEHLQFATATTKCQSPKEPHKVQLCALKGERPNVRVSYKTKSDVAKLCLRTVATQGAYAAIEAVEAAVDAERCESIMKNFPVEQQGTFAETTTTTTGFSPGLEEDSSDDDATVSCDCEDGFVGKFRENQCTCEAAPCDVKGAVGEGPDCECMPGLHGDISWVGATAKGECIIDAKDLFREGEMRVWNYKGKAIKCCVPTVIAPTELQDMNADTLPSLGKFGRSTKTGCGYMFGDHYHNGMKAYKARTEPTCPVSVEKLMQVTGETYEEMKYILNLDGS